MKIVIENNKRLLIKDNNTIINMSDNEIIQYKAIYYKKSFSNQNDYYEIYTLFIGIIETDRYRYDEGITGIYIRPLYIFNLEQNQWNKVIDYPPPKKYFLYPHLLMLPNTYYQSNAIYTLETCENKSLDEYNHITELFDLNKIYNDLKKIDTF